MLSFISFLWLAGGVADGKGDGSYSVKVGTTLARIYDKNACDAKYVVLVQLNSIFCPATIIVE